MSSAALAQADNTSVFAKASTLGFGGGVAYGLSERVNVRVGYLMLNFEADIHTDDYDYDGRFKLGGAETILDWHPFGNGFRLSAGIIFSRNKIDLEARLDDVVTIGGRNYVIDDLADMSGDVEFNPVTPYLGLGWGNFIGTGNRWSFFIDAGAQYYGSPSVSLHADCSPLGNSVAPTACRGLDAAVEKEENDLNYEVKDYKWYPVLNIGLAYRF